MLNPVRFGTVVLGSCVLALGLTSAPALADPEHGSELEQRKVDVSPPDYQPPAAVRIQADAKYRMARAYVDYQDGTGTREDYVEATEDYEARYGELMDSTSPVIAASQNRNLGSAVAGRRVLNLKHYAQVNGQFCGPASGKMILKHLRAGRSAYDGTKQRQRNIGNRNHMRTSINGVTRWSSGLFRVGLNRWLHGTNSGQFIDEARPTPKYMKGALRYDIDRGIPFGADTVEFQGENYNGHPKDQLIGHWIVAHGYGKYGKRVAFADPATSVWPEAKPHFNVKTKRFTKKYLQTNGITW